MQAHQLKVLILVSIKIVMEIPKMKSGLFPLLNKWHYVIFHCKM